MRKLWTSQVRQGRLSEHFVAGTIARTAASSAGAHHNTSAYFFHRLREIVLLELDVKSEAVFGGEIEVDESYFGGKLKGKLGRDTMRLMLPNSNTIGSTIQTFLQKAKTTLMRSRISGTRPSATCAELTGANGTFWVIF